MYANYTGHYSFHVLIKNVKMPEGIILGSFFLIKDIMEVNKNFDTAVA